jgi:arachidonate 5-lipoxygenase
MLYRFLQFLIALYRRVELAVVTFVVTLLVTANSLIFRVRMSHENGIACSGRLRIVDNPAFPAHPFFKPGRSFDCRIRHGAASFKDDAKLVVRSASIKFNDARFESPLDILMNTGHVPLFWNARTFVGFMASSMAGKGKFYVSYLRQHPQAAVGGGDSVRRDPESFGRMVYHTKTVSGFVGEDGRLRYARYRLVPDPWDGQETGLPGVWDREHSWLQNPDRDEARDRNYLKKATRAFFKAGGVLKYRLQIQLRDEPPPGADTQWMSSAVPWDEQRFPYLDLAVVEADKALSYEESMLTWFHLGNRPPSLPIPKARSIDDPHSLNHLRLASIWARRARLLSYRLRGMPKPFPDSRKAPDWDGIPSLRNPP